MNDYGDKVYLGDSKWAQRVQLTGRNVEQQISTGVINPGDSFTVTRSMNGYSRVSYGVRASAASCID